jgi:hypothetical protein
LPAKLENRERASDVIDSSVLVAIGWLFALHALADVMIGIYRCRNVDPALTDLLAAALPRSQICLLAIWLAVGSERFSWRLSGLVAGVCFLFTIFSRWVFPDQHLMWPGAHWVEEEWLHYFRLSGPGDLLVKSPILVGGLAASLFVLRMGRAVRTAHQSGWTIGRPWPRFRFQYGFREVAIWSTAICLGLIAVYQTAPYTGWTGQVVNRWKAIYRFSDAQAVYTVTSAAVYVLVALGSLGAVYSKAGLRWRIPAWAILAVVPGLGFEIWLHRIAARFPPDSVDRIWSRASAETLTSVVAALTITGSLALVRLYASFRRVRRPRGPNDRALMAS